MCKPNSDIDLYIQLDGKHRKLIETQGTNIWGTKILIGESGQKFMERYPKIPEVWKKLLSELKVDLFFGVDDKPPMKPMFKGLKYYINLEDL